MSYFVSRQKYWGEDRNVVEIAIGGCDYANPDMLVPKFKGEGKDYDDPREAANVALEIQRAWNEVCPICNAEIAYGYTGGSTLPFDEASKQELLDWANKEYESLDKCARCGCLLGKPRDRYKHIDFDDEEFCSEFCAEESARRLETQDGEDESMLN